MTHSNHPGFNEYDEDGNEIRCPKCNWNNWLENNNTGNTYCVNCKNNAINEGISSFIKEDKPIVYTTDYSDYASCPNCGIPDGNCNC